MKKCAILFLLFFLGIELSQAQQMVVYKKRHYKKYTFKEDENIKIWLKENGEIVKGKWKFADENKILLNAIPLDLKDIGQVSLVKKEKGIWILRKGQDLLILAGLGLVTITQLNRVVQPETAVPKKVYTQSARLIAGGLTCTVLDRSLRRRKARIGPKFGLYILP